VQSGSRLAVFLAKTLDATGGVDNFLFAGIERMAGRADFNVKALATGGLSLELVATTASDFNLGVLRVNAFFHFSILSSIMLFRRSS